MLDPLSILVFVAAVCARSEQQFWHVPASHSSNPATGLEPDNFTSYLATVGKAFNLPGVAIAVVRKDQEPEYYNWGNRTEEGDPPNEDTMFSIGSCSKAFNAISLGILMDEFKHGRNVTALPAGVDFDWTTKAADILPGIWQLHDEWASSKSSLLDLLSHVTGLPRHEFSYDETMRLDDLVSGLRYLRPTYELREKWQYNNLMYSTTSYLTSKYSNQSYTSFVQERIFDALGMAATTYHPQKAFDSGLLAHNWIQTAGPHFNETRRIPYFLDDWSDATVVNGFLAGAGGVISSPRDLTKWVRTLLNEGRHPDTGKQVIPSSVLETVMTGRSIVEGKAEYPELSPKVYGAGWWRFSYQGHEIVQHGGNVPGSTTLISLLPNDGMGIISLSNGNGQNDALDALANRIIEDTFGLKRVDWLERYVNKTKTDVVRQQELRDAVTASAAGTSSLSSFLGTYASPGYVGNLTLCAWPSPPGSDCAAVLQAYATVDANFSLSASSSLYASWPRFWTSHLKLTQKKNDSDGTTTFALALDTLYPEGYGRDRTPFFHRANAGDESVV